MDLGLQARAPSRYRNLAVARDLHLLGKQLG